jgi:tetratricopeptide (TPR) repeat protein
MRTWGPAAIAMAALLAAAPGIAQPVKRSAPVAGKVSAARGGEEATLVPERQWRRVVASQDLKAGDVLRTNANGTLAIVFADRTQIRLGRNSVLVVKAVAAAGPSSLELQRGRLWGRSPRARSNLKVETPSATAAIRGTEWAIEATPDSTALAVYEGAVEFFNDFGTLAVGGGEAASARAGQAPTRTILADPVGRTQMLFFLRPRDGIEILRGQSTALEAYLGGLDAESAPEEPPLDPSDPASFAVSGFLAAYRGDLAEAQRIADQGLAAYPGALGLFELKARTALLQGDAATARAATAAALAIDPADPAALAISAEIAAQFDGEPLIARDLAKRAVAADPERIGSLQTLADILAERDADREALRAIDAALARDPGNAAMLARRAGILLKQDRFPATDTALSEAEALDPSLAIVRAARAEYLVRSGKLAEAEEHARAASAENPAYARALVQLAEIAARSGDIAEARQQLDAADRLDPEEPRTALARTAIALNRFSADEAIAGANEALKRFQARGGVYTNLSENRAAGSLVSQAFRFLELEGWGRYYADRVFDSFTPSSYFDQALNQTPGPFFVRDAEGRFNPLASADLDRFSSFLQGLSLDPLGVANSERRIQFSNERFAEARLSAGILAEDLRTIPSGRATFDGLATGPLPAAISIDARWRRDEDRRQRPDLGAARAVPGEQTRIESYIGLEPGADDQIVVNVLHERTTTEGRALPGAPAPDNRRELREIGQDRLFALWSHGFGWRDRLTVAAGIGRFVDNRVRGFDAPGETLFASDVETEYLFAGLSYARSFGALDAKLGFEYTELERGGTSRILDQDLQVIRPDPDGQIRFESLLDTRTYLDLRYAGIRDVILEAQIEWVRGRDEGRPIETVTGGFTLDFFNWRIGAAWEPVQGHWLRAGFFETNDAIFDFTLKPVNLIGLKPNFAPQQSLAPSRNTIARWDAQWSERFFTSVEYQHQDLEGLNYTFPDVNIGIFGGADLDRISADANLHLPGNLGFRLAYAYTDSAISFDFITRLQPCTTRPAGGPQPGDCLLRFGDPVPFIARHFGQASVTWTVPAPVRLRANLAASTVRGLTTDAGRPIAGSTLVDGRIEWEPFDRRLALRLGLLNLFDERYETVRGFPAPRRTITADVTLRF